MRLKNCRDRSLQSFAAMEDYLGARRRRKLPGRDTYLARCHGFGYAVLYRGTPVVRVFRDEHGEDYWYLIARDWRSRTTQSRINQYSPARVWQEHGVWYCGRTVLGNPIPFEDGVRVDAIGGVSLPSGRAERQRKFGETGQ